jgi:hypothetical protein
MGSWTSTTDTYSDVELDNINTGYNIWNGTGWDGWCVDNGNIIDLSWYTNKAVECSISLSSGLPDWYDSIDWSKINWIINNRESNHTMEDVQDTIWHYINNLAYGNLSQNSKNLVDGAEGYSGTFITEVGQKYAVILDANIGRCIQRIIIEAVRTCFCEACH